MTSKSEKIAIIAITIIVASIIFAVYVINGSEQDDLWLYLAAIFCVLSIPFLTYNKKVK